MRERHPGWRRSWGVLLLWTVAGGALAASCGDATVSATSYDRPLFTFGGRFNPDASAGISSLRVGVVWIYPGQTRDDLPASPETMRFEPTPAGYKVSFFAPPPPSVIYDLLDPTTKALATSFAFGEIVAYDDRDGDGTFAISSREAGSEIVPPDVYLGATDGAVVRYLVAPLSPQSSLLPGLGGMLMEGPDYAIGLISCVPADAPMSHLLAAESEIVLQLDPTGSAALPFKRTCLRSEPVPPQPTPPGP